MSTSPPPDVRRVRYLSRVLQLNPLQRAEQIVQLRSAYLGLKGPAAEKNQGAAGEDLQEKRERGASAIENVRQQFWKMDLGELQSELAGLQLDEFPDLKHAAARLRVTAAHRKLLPRISGNADFDGEFFSALKEILVQSPREAAGTKEKVLRSLRDPVRRKSVQQMVKLLDREMPELYDVEEDWLESIRHHRPGKRSKAGGGGVSFDGWGWIIWVLIVIGLRLVRMAMGD